MGKKWQVLWGFPKRVVPQKMDCLHTMEKSYCKASKYLQKIEESSANGHSVDIQSSAIPASMFQISNDQMFHNSNHWPASRGKQWLNAIVRQFGSDSYTDLLNNSSVSNVPPPQKNETTITFQGLSTDNECRPTEPAHQSWKTHLIKSKRVSDTYNTPLLLFQNQNIKNLKPLGSNADRINNFPKKIA